MKRKNLPAWQQVLLVALNNVPKAKNGRDAWNKLNDGEKAAVTDFLAEHCGEEAQAKLEETCGKIKHGRGWKTTLGLLIVLAILAVFVGAMLWLDKYVEGVHRYLWVVVCLRHMIRAWNGDRQGNMQIIWWERVNTQHGTSIALRDMHRTLELSSEVLRNKKDLIFWAILMILWIAMIVLDIFW